jgi:hypothetical protein
MAPTPKAKFRFITPAVRLATRVAVAGSVRVYARIGIEVKKKSRAALLAQRVVGR